MATATETLRERFSPAPETVQWAAVVINIELAALLFYAIVLQPYFGFRFNSLFDWRLALYPFVWINVALWAVWRTRPAPTSRRKQYLAGAIAVGYLLLLSYAGGLISIAGGTAYAPRFALDLPPGWSPALLYGGSVVQLAILPYKLVGYLALSYLVYATVIDAASSALSGVLGLLSCVSCSWPILASLASGIFGTTSAVALATSSYSYGISTVVFVVTVALLVWRPTIR